MWFAPRSAFGRFWFYEETANLQYGRIIGNQSNGIWTQVDNVPQNNTFTETESQDANRLYTQELVIDVPHLDVESRDALEQYVVNGDLMVAFELQDGAVWLAGETHGLRAGTNGQSNTVGQPSGSTLTLTARERYPIRQLAPDYVASYLLPPTLHLSELSITELEIVITVVTLLNQYLPD